MNIEQNEQLNKMNRKMCKGAVRIELNKFDLYLDQNENKVSIDFSYMLEISSYVNLSYIKK